MTGTLGNARKQQWTAGDRLQVFLGLCQAHEDIPPVVDEGDHARGEPAAREVMRGEAAPTPLVLQFVERVRRARLLRRRLTPPRRIASKADADHGGSR